MIKKILKSIKRRLMLRKNRQLKIGRYQIKLPPMHMLDTYQKNYKNYDKKLPEIAKLVMMKYPKMSIIDIGANIGDSAAALRDSCNAPLICVEGNPKYIPFLELNNSKLPGINRIVNKFIGDSNLEINGSIISENGTARIDRKATRPRDDQQHGTLQFISYKEILRLNADLPEVHLIKTDTDGFDFKIILGLLPEISVTLPVLFIEFDPAFSPATEKFEAITVMAELTKCGYKNYIIFDNFGNYLFSFSENQNERFIDLFCFLDQSRNFGGGVCYLDVCCFSEADYDVFSEVVRAECGELRDQFLSTIN